MIAGVWIVGGCFRGWESAIAWSVGLSSSEIFQVKVKVNQRGSRVRRRRSGLTRPFDGTGSLAGGDCPAVWALEKALGLLLVVCD
jgi:hypothetical protein